ncbi:MAG: hypothetical protein ACLQBD_17045 [Syntrophobacteraceae bacterium]
MGTRLGKAINRLYLKLCEHRYEKYSDALAAWEGVKLSCQAQAEYDEPFPDWVCGYLLKTAEGLLQINKLRETKTRTDKRLLTDALGISSFGKFEQHSQFEIKAKVYWEVTEERARRKGRRYGRGTKSVYEQAAENLASKYSVGIAPETVDAYYKEIQETMNEFTTELVT